MPSGLNATPDTASLCPVSGSPRGFPVVASQRITVLSLDAEASVLPSGLNATPFTGPLCPASGSPRGLPRGRRPRGSTVLSSDAEARVLPSGLNATPLTVPLCPCWKRINRGFDRVAAKSVLNVS